MIQRYFYSYALYPVVEKSLNREILTKLDKLKQYYNTPFVKREASMRERLHNLVSFAARTIPFYKRHYAGLEANIENIRKDIKYFEEMPTIQRSDIFRDAVSFFNPNQTSGAEIHKRNTGGSTGASAFVFYDNEALDWTAATNLYAYEMTGKKRHYSECHLSSALSLPTTFKSKWVQKIKNASLNRTELKTGPLNDDNLEFIFQELQALRPYLLQGHPSTVYALSRYILKKHAPEKLFNVFESTGEMISKKMVEDIEKACGCKVYNRYGNAEAGVVAHSESDFNRLKVMDFTVYPEVIDSEITITTLTNRFMPLIRYKTGDLASLEKAENGYFFTDILGRVHDEIELNGILYLTHYIQDFLDHEIGGIAEFQIIQDSKTNIKTLKVKAVDPTQEERIRKSIEKKWPGAMRVDFVENFSDFLRVGREGKFRHILKV